MRSNSKVFGWILLAAALVGMGCQTKTPPFAAVIPQKDYYDLFTYNGGSMQINPSLPMVTPGQPLGSVTIPNPPPAITYQTFPTDLTIINQPVTIDGTTYSGVGTQVQPTSATGVNFVPSGLTDYPVEAHVEAWIEDPESPVYPPGPGNYDSVFLRAWPNSTTNNSMFDVSAYSGMQFYINVAGIDNAVVKQFHIVTDQTLKGAPGECGSLGAPNLVHCYDDFYYDWSAVPRDEWVLVEQRWDAFKMYGNGSIPNPPTFSGANLQQVFYFAWIEGNGALPGPVTVNFAVTGAKFF